MNQIAPISRANSSVSVILPQSIDEVWRVARMAVVGKMAPQSLVKDKDPDEATSACAVAIMAGAELGLTPLMALRSYAVINGRPSLWGDGIKAVVRQSGRCEYIRTGSNQTVGWCESKRSDTGEEKRVEFTWAQAVAAGLDKKAGPWKDGYRDVMMERRATNRCLNDLYADVLGGIVSADEAHDSAPFSDEPREVAAVSPPSPPSPPTIEHDAPIIDELPEAVTGEDFDAAMFFEQLEAAMAGAKDTDAVEAAWVEFDVESVLADDDLNRDIADKIKSRRLSQIGSA